MIGPYFGQLSEQYTDIVFLKVDVDANAVSPHGRQILSERQCAGGWVAIDRLHGNKLMHGTCVLYQRLQLLARVDV